MVVGDKPRRVLPDLYDLLSQEKKNENQSILWISKEKIQIQGKSEKKKSQEASGVEQVNHLNHFLRQPNVRYVLYKETEKILGSTYSMCVLQDFEAMTPNFLARCIETVKGGGIVVLLLKAMPSLDQLRTLEMDVYSRYRTESFVEIAGRFNQRFALSLLKCDSCFVVNDDLQILHCGEPNERKIPMDTDSIINSDSSLVILSKTKDQANALVAFMDAIATKKFKHTVSLTAGRGRGKSAALGLSVASAVAAGYSNIFITSPSPENLTTLFQFIIKGLGILGYQEKIDYETIQSTNPAFNRAITSISIFKTHRQTIRYIQPENTTSLSQAELLVIDEAAAIPLPLVKKLLGPYLVFLASTINGYEGTGRSLSLKLIQQLREQKHVKKSDRNFGRTLVELSLDEPIRYASSDPIEEWLNKLLCLEATEGKLLDALPDAMECQLLHIDRDALFSFSERSEEFLHKVMALYVASHYKNSPNDLQLLSDAPAHQLYVLTGPSDNTKLPEPLCVIQIALEGNIPKSTVVNSLNRGARASGDLIPWMISQQFQDFDFPNLLGARVVRIATHPDCMSKGYGAHALSILQDYFQGRFTSETSEKVPGTELDFHLLQDLGSVPTPELSYIGVSFGLTPQLNRFWKKAGYAPVYLRQTPNELTGEYSCIMMKSLKDNTQLSNFAADFRHRFMCLLSYEFRSFTTVQALSIMQGAQNACKDNNALTKLTKEEAKQKISNIEIALLVSYSNNLLDYSAITHMLPTLAEWYLNKRFPAKLVLSPVQSAILLGTGLQRKDIGAVSRELDLSASLILSMFEKTIRQLAAFLHVYYEA